MVEKKFPRVPEWARPKPERTIDSDLRNVIEEKRMNREDQFLHRIGSLEDALEEEEDNDA